MVRVPSVCFRATMGKQRTSWRCPLSALYQLIGCAQVRCRVRFTRVFFEGNRAPNTLDALSVGFRERALEKIEALPCWKRLLPLLVGDLRRELLAVTLVNVPAAVHKDLRGCDLHDGVSTRIQAEQGLILRQLGSAVNTQTMRPLEIDKQ